MLSIQEIVQKDEVKTQLRNVEDAMDGYKLFHPEVASVLNVEDYSLRLQLEEALQKIPLREFLAKSGTTGIGGAAYLVPDAMHMHILGASKLSDKVPQFAAEVVEGWVGGDLKVDIAVRQQEIVGTDLKRKWTLQPRPFSSGGTMPTQTVETIQATLTPVSFSVAPRISSDLIEDANFALFEWHLNQAAQQLGYHATDLAISDLKAAADGDGAANTLGATSPSTTATNILDAVAQVGAEFWHPDTMIVTHEAWADNISDMTNAAPAPNIVFPPAAPEYDMKFHVLDTIFSTSSNLFATITTKKFTLVVTLVLDRSAALLCGRKRWMQIENYAEPVADLSGVVISCRQDCVTLYKDACCVITEA